MAAEEGTDTSPKTTMTKTSAPEEEEEEDPDAAKDIRAAVYLPGNEDHFVFSASGK
jgi:hypothetical protein